MTEPNTPSGHRRHLREKAVDEFSRLVILFGYLWVVFELLSVHKSVVLSEYHLDYPEHAFAIINSLVFAKVLLTRNWVCACTDREEALVQESPANPHPLPRAQRTSEFGCARSFAVLLAI
jgi:hypothetical protein